MYGEYTCPFINYSGETCGRSCMREEGCSIHWKYVRKLIDKQLIPCKECVRLRDLEIQVLFALISLLLLRPACNS